MAAQPPDQEIERLLADLRGDDSVRRGYAAEEIATLQLHNEEVVNALKAAAETDSSPYVRQAALKALRSIGVPVSDIKPHGDRNASAKPVVQLSHNQKILHFTVGFVGWFAVNGGVWIVVPIIGGVVFNNVYLNLLILPANLVVLLILAFKRRRVAFGMLTAMALNFLIAVILAQTFFDAVCFIPFFHPSF